jgi:hypothetical protein
MLSIFAKFRSLSRSRVMELIVDKTKEALVFRQWRHQRRVPRSVLEFDRCKYKLAFYYSNSFACYRAEHEVRSPQHGWKSLVRDLSLFSLWKR